MTISLVRGDIDSGIVSLVPLLDVNVDVDGDGKQVVGDDVKVGEYMGGGVAGMIVNGARWGFSWTSMVEQLEFFYTRLGAVYVAGRCGGDAAK